jgi:glycosyltransferase involved in cell wall biosynthesis
MAPPDARRAPLLSVVTPMRDAASHVGEAVESILAQSFTDFEFLIFDDGSSDDSCKVVESYAKSDPRIRLFRGSPVGYAVWLREGVSRARGELIARMDADDVSHPERFAHQVRYLEGHLECVALGAQILIVDPERRPIQRREAPLQHEAIDAALLRGRGEALPHSVAMFRRHALLEVGNYRTDRLWGEDVDLYLRLAEVGRLANLPDVLLEYRRHPRAVGAAHRREQRSTLKCILADTARRRGLLEREMRVLPDLPSIRLEDLWHDWARGALGGGHPSTARHYARLLLRAEPFSPRSWRLAIRAALGLSLSRLRRKDLPPASPR